MTQGRKSRTVLTIGCVGCALAMLAGAAAIAPAFAGAQAAVDEYELGDLPNPDNEGGESQSGDDQGGIAPTSSSGSGTPSGPAGEPAGQTGAAGGDGSSGSGSGNAGGGGDGGGSAGASAGASGSGDESEGVNLADTPTATEPVRAVDAEPSDGGGAPVLLILLAVVAAICTGVAIWRLRRNTDDSNTGVGRGAGKAAKTQSL